MGKKSGYGVALFISVLLHGLVVFFPWQEKPRPSEVSSSTPALSISVVELPTSPESEPQPAPTVPPPPPVVTPVATPADLSPEAPSPETMDSPPDQPAPEADPDANLPPENPSPETNGSSIDEAKIAADWENLVGHFQGQNQGFDSFTLLDIFNFFGEPEQAKQFFDEDNQPKLDVSSFYLFPEQTPEEVLQTVVIPELTSNTGFDLQPQENVSAGLAYQILQGEMLRYLIIVKLNEGSGSVLMLSNSLLGLES